MSIGDETASIKATISRSNIELAQAEEFFCGRMLSVVLTVLENGEDPNQKTLTGVKRPTLKGTATFSKYTVGTKDVGAGMKFSLGDINSEDLCHFAKRDGTLEVLKIMGTIEEDSDEEASE